MLAYEMVGSWKIDPTSESGIVTALLGAPTCAVTNYRWPGPEAHRIDAAVTTWIVRWTRSSRITRSSRVSPRAAASTRPVFDFDAGANYDVHLRM